MTLTVTAQLDPDSGTETDITDDVISVDVEHGARFDDLRGRYRLLTASGTVAVAPDLWDPTSKTGRLQHLDSAAPISATVALDDHTWTGHLVPTGGRVFDLERPVRLRLQSPYRDRLAGDGGWRLPLQADPADRSAARVAAEMIGHLVGAAAWSPGPATPSGIRLTGVWVDGSIADAVDDVALASAAVPVETRSGTIRFAAPALADTALLRTDVPAVTVDRVSRLDLRPAPPDRRLDILGPNLVAAETAVIDHPIGVGSGLFRFEVPTTGGGVAGVDWADDGAVKPTEAGVDVVWSRTAPMGDGLGDAFWGAYDSTRQQGSRLRVTGTVLRLDPAGPYTVRSVPDLDAAHDLADSTPPWIDWADDGSASATVGTESWEQLRAQARSDWEAEIVTPDSATVPAAAADPGTVSDWTLTLPERPGSRLIQTVAARIFVLRRRISWETGSVPRLHVAGHTRPAAQ